MANEPQLNYMADLIQHQGEVLGDKPYILFEDRVISFADFSRATRCVANGFAEAGARPGDGVAILMANCPEFISLYHGLTWGGFYSVPTNIALKGDGLRYILAHSDAKFLVVDEDLYPAFADLEQPVGSIEKVFVQRSSDAPLPEGTFDFAAILEASDDRPSHVIDPSAISSILYTSGTTGHPKGVVGRNGPGGGPAGSKALASRYLKPGDIMYTALPLFHGNAMGLTVGVGMAMGVPFGLDRRFSASRFWDRTRHYGATQFNALGAMIPILMKQPEKPNDNDNPIRLVLSAACPANLWEAFEKRFNVTIWEFYGAIDGGGVLTFNLGTAPVGSIGKPDPDVEYMLRDGDGNEVAQGEVGEWTVHLKNRVRQSVEYYKNKEASDNKVRDGWLYSGDLMYEDENGFLFFADRKTDSMRRRGENISSYEVENAIVKHPAITACAAFGVPSELGEDEVMVWIKPVEGEEIDFEDLMHHCIKNMAHFMIPRFIDIVDDIPQTGTLRVQKSNMKKRGVTERTWDREKELPSLKLK